MTTVYPEDGRPVNATVETHPDGNVTLRFGRSYTLSRISPREVGELARLLEQASDSFGVNVSWVNESRAGRARWCGTELVVRFSALDDEHGFEWNEDSRTWFEVNDSATPVQIELTGRGTK